jgi:hypothetical protein
MLSAFPGALVALLIRCVVSTLDLCLCASRAVVEGIIFKPHKAICPGVF